MLGRQIGLLGLVLAGCSPEARYQRIVDRVDAGAVQLAVLEPGGGAWHGASGEDGSGEALTTDHVLLVGSNTKSWTAAIVLTLADEGRLDLDDSAAEWVPALDPAVTVRDLLQHTSGMGEYFEHDDMQGSTGEAWTPDQLIALGQDVRDDGPSQDSVYSNTNYIALGLLIEEVTGQRYADALQERVLDPLGMHSAGLVDAGEAPPENCAWGDGGIHGTVTPADPSVGWAAGSGYATAEDLVTFHEGILAGALYSADLVAEQFDAVPADLGFDDPDLVTRYGLGIMFVGIGDQTVIGHLGTLEGFASISLRDADTGAFVAVLSNSSEPADVVQPALKALRVAGKQ